MKKEITYRFLLFTFAFLLFNSCKKENLKYEQDYRYRTEASETSTVRLINLSINNQLVVNGDSLTNFWLPPERPGYIPPEERTPPGTPYFPKDGQLGLVWDIPQDLFQAEGKANMKTTRMSVYDNVIPEEFMVEELHIAPKDYYLLYNQRVEWERPVVEVPRSITSPSKPDHFKIRIINFAAKPNSISSPMENLLSPITLAFADGKPISSTTSDIQPGSWSDYVEVPYGTYQLKVLTSDGRQVPSAGQNGIMHPATSTLARIGSLTASSDITYAGVRTFQPGGVYTVVIHPKDFTWSNGRDEFQDLQNSFHIISDISEPQNNTYTRIQLANAMPGSSLNFYLGNDHVGSATAAGEGSDYRTLVAGTKELRVQDASGNTLVSSQENLVAGANYTLWVYADATGQPASLLVKNNLGGTWFMGDGQTSGNAAVDRRQSDFPFDFRFLNLVPDIPYLSVTDGSGLPFGSQYSLNSGSNLPFGKALVDNPYTRIAFSQLPFVQGQPTRNITGPYQFLAFQSEPGKLPGEWMDNIPPLSSEALVAREALYTEANRPVPAHEPGVYTVALIGRYTAGNNNAKFMVIKHTK